MANLVASPFPSHDKKTNLRVVAVRILEQVLQSKRSLSAILAEQSSLLQQSNQASLVMQLCYGVLRFYPRLMYLANDLLEKPLAKKDNDILLLILIGFYQLLYLSIPAHAAVNETVNATHSLNKKWAKGLVNALLRALQRNQDELNEKLDHIPECVYSHPTWMIEMLKSAWPRDWESILLENNKQAPFTLRVNHQKISTKDYLDCLQAAGKKARMSGYSGVGITLDDAGAVEELPYFMQGFVSVQDNASQLAAELLELKPNMSVLDVCAAPGGKTCHMLEHQPALKKITALEIDEERAGRITQNAKRLNVEDKIDLKIANAVELTSWWDGHLYDRILLDAPCSASGVIRRHPDIKWLRQEKDIAALAMMQTCLLETIWQTLQPQGLLVYATCSIFPQETVEIIHKFLEKQKDAKLLPIKTPWGVETDNGRFVLPGMENMDGFFYARLIKQGE